MAVQCGQCPQTFRNETGKEWHVQHRHGDSPAQDNDGQVNGDELSGMIENEVSAQIAFPDSPLNVALDARIIGFRKEVAQMIADSDQFMRAHLEHRVKEIVIAITSLHREPTWNGQPVEMAEPVDALASYLRPDPVTHRRSSSGGQVGDINANIECAAACIARYRMIELPPPVERSNNHNGVHNFLASLEGS